VEIIQEAGETDRASRGRRVDLGVYRIRRIAESVRGEWTAKHRLAATQ